MTEPNSELLIEDESKKRAEEESRTEKARVSFDDVLKELGEFGPYQMKIYFLLFLPTIFSAMHKLAWVFLGAKVSHRCRLSDEPENSTYHKWEGQNLTDYLHWDPEVSRYDQCHKLNGSDPTSEVNCDNGWVYDRTTFGSSAIMEWDLVCDRLWMRATAQALFMVGVLIGSYVFGEASDRFGRKPTFIASVIIQTVFGLLAGLLPEYWSFVVARMVIGMTTSGVFLVSYVLAMEMVGPKYRVVAGTLCQYYYTFGFFAMGLVAYFLNDNWHLLQIVLTIPTAIFVVYWWIIPESVRWLISKGKYDEARKIIEKTSAENGRPLTEGMLEKMFETTKLEKEKDINKNSLGLLDLFRYPNLARNSLIVFYNWFVNSGTYYGLSLSASDLGGNPYINFLISAAVEIPAYALVLLVLNRLGRKIPLCCFMLIAGLALVVTIFIEKEQTVWLITLSMIGKLSITASYGIIYIFSAEIFPTPIRNVAVGAASMSARIGGILCPYLNMLGEYWRPLPLIVYGVFAFSGGLLSLLLPETLNKKLPETIEEGEHYNSIETVERAS